MDEVHLPNDNNECMIVVLGFLYIGFGQDYQFLNKGFFYTQNLNFQVINEILNTHELLLSYFN